MKFFAERNPFVIGAIGCTLTAAIVLGALQYDTLPFVNSDKHYSAYFAEAGGLKDGAAVQVSGFKAGQVSTVELDGNKVLVKFTVDNTVWLGDRTEAAIKTRTILGTKILEITPRGEDPLSATIPLERTISPYQLPDALGDLTATISGLDTDQLSQSLSVLAQTFQDTPPHLRDAAQGVARLAQTVNERDAVLRELLTNANKATTVLAERSDRLVDLIANTNALLIQVQSQSAALDSISTHTSALAQQLSGFIAENRAQMKPALDKLNGVLATIENRKERVQKSLTLLNQYAMSLGEALSSGPFFKAYVANILPGQFLQPFIDAAFSDLGLDPAALLPSQRTEPQTGQPGTPALPVPYPRTGQGGDPHLTLPDAITGVPGDPRYPYRPPLPQPAPGGPPPGPPAGYDAATPAPTSPPVYVPAPGETPPATSAPVPEEEHQ